eukprot:CAMPEP_0113880094 /NCGR_PEP_ID=MMETSP0780_2-20120614/7598_1 /TAXON_ID=652834 /ORGANISM="Palpitomonas bilix" /LENGTH=571 /DNA_ID=CAMNT_0000866739 /DNA_START=67 /DNA_END=1781 /DNA_ORIENTATION=- /assembly_acc=CAM_ASM_000599
MARRLHLVVFSILFCLNTAASHGSHEEKGVDYSKPDPFKEGSLVLKHSLKGPYKSDDDLGQWSVADSTTLKDEYIRLTHDEKSKVGWLFNDVPLFSKTFAVDIQFKVTGKRYVGGDGFVFWILKTPKKAGRTFGHDDLFEGLGIFFDSYDNDGARNNPAVVGMFNAEGEALPYDHDNDGKKSMLPGATCRFNFRNTKEAAVVRVVVLPDGKLEVFTSTKGASFQKCFSSEGVVLPPGYYIGFSAATGDVADNHDIYSVNFYSLDTEVDTKKLEREEARHALEKTVHGAIPGEKHDDLVGSGVAPAKTSPDSVLRKVAADADEFREERMRDTHIRSTSPASRQTNSEAPSVDAALNPAPTASPTTSPTTAASSSGAVSGSALTPAVMAEIVREISTTVAPVKGETERMITAMHALEVKVDAISITKDAIESALHKLSDTVDNLHRSSVQGQAAGADAASKDVKRLQSTLDVIRSEVGALGRQQNHAQEEVARSMTIIQTEMRSSIASIQSTLNELVQIQKHSRSGNDEASSAGGIGLVTLVVVVCIQSVFLIFGEKVMAMMTKKQRKMDHFL